MALRDNMTVNCLSKISSWMFVHDRKTAKKELQFDQSLQYVVSVAVWQEIAHML